MFVVETGEGRTISETRTARFGGRKLDWNDYHRPGVGLTIPARC